MGAFWITSIILGIIGIAVGTAAPLWAQAIIFLVIVLYLSSSSVAAMEIGAIIPIMFGIFFIGGMIIGDISYIFQTGGIDFKGIPNPFVVSK